MGRPKIVDYDLVIEYRNDGYSCEEISKKLGITKGHVANICFRYKDKIDVFIPRSKVDDEKQNKIVELRNNNLSVVMVALKCGVSKATVSLVCKKNPGYIKQYSRERTRSRNNEIVKMRNKNIPQTEIASKYDITAERVRQICKKYGGYR